MKNWHFNALDKLNKYKELLKKNIMIISKIKDIIKIDSPYILIIGMRASGKSLIVKDIVKKLYNYTAKIAISKTEELNKFYYDFIEYKYIYDTYDSNILNRVFERQQLLINDNYHTAVILDDCMSSKGDWIKNEEIINLFDNKNIHKLKIIMTMQFPLNIPTIMKECFDYVFLLQEHFRPNRKRLYEHYGYHIFISFEEFENIMLEIIKTNHFNCLVLDIKNKKYFIYNSNNII